MTEECVSSVIRNRAIERGKQENQHVGTAKYRYNCIRPESRAKRANINPNKKRLCAQPTYSLCGASKCACMSKCVCITLESTNVGALKHMKAILPLVK